MHSLSQRTILRRHLRDPVQDRLNIVGLLGALLALGTYHQGPGKLKFGRVRAWGGSDIPSACTTSGLAADGPPQAAATVVLMTQLFFPWAGRR